MFFSPLNHFEPIQIFTLSSPWGLFSIDSITFTIITVFVLFNLILFFSVYQKPFFISKLNNIINNLISNIFPSFNEKPFRTNRGLIPFFITIFLSLSFFNLITLFIPLFYPIAVQFFITFYLAGLVLGSVFLTLLYRYKGLIWYAFTVNSEYEIIAAFLFFIEIFSFVMRIFSLSGRLSLNMFSGHMLLFLITNASFHLYNMLGFTSFLIYLPLVIFIHILETFVAVLQAYVFTYLSIYYFKEAIG
jgi:F-type H+-transporting ATPase subunit a